MKRELSDKTCVLQLFDGARFFITKERADKIIQVIGAGKKGISFDETWINVSSIRSIISGADYLEVERVKRGDYKCPNCDHWIPKGKSCGFC